MFNVDVNIFINPPHPTPHTLDLNPLPRRRLVWPQQHLLLCLLARLHNALVRVRVRVRVRVHVCVGGSDDDSARHVCGCVRLI